MKHTHQKIIPRRITKVKDYQSRISVIEANRAYPAPLEEEYPPVTFERIDTRARLQRDAFIKGFEFRNKEIQDLKLEIKLLKHHYE